MKKILLFVTALILICTVLSACSIQEEEEVPTNPPMFEVIEDGYYYDVVYNKATKVMYAVSDDTHSHGVFTLLVNADGTPMTYKGE